MKKIKNFAFKFALALSCAALLFLITACSGKSARELENERIAASIRVADSLAQVDGLIKAAKAKADKEASVFLSGAMIMSPKCQGETCERFQYELRVEENVVIMEVSDYYDGQNQIKQVPLDYIMKIKQAIKKKCPDVSLWSYDNIAAFNLYNELKAADKPGDRLDKTMAILIAIQHETKWRMDFNGWKHLK